MSRRAYATSIIAGPCAKLLLLLAFASRPAEVEGFAVMPHAGSFGIRSSGANPAHSSSENPAGGLATGSSSSKKRRSCMLFMGASRDDHTDRKDQWEGWDTEDSGAEEDAVSGRRPCARARWLGG